MHIEMGVLVALVGVIVGMAMQTAYIIWRMGRMEGKITEQVEALTGWVREVEERVKRLEKPFFENRRAE